MKDLPDKLIGGIIPRNFPKWSNKPRKAFTLALNKPQAEELLLALSKDQSSLEDEDYSDLVEQLTHITEGE